MQTINNKFYFNAYKEHGVSAKGVHWHSKKNQYKRFEILTSFLKNIDSSSIIDVGCGFGEYLNFLEKIKIKPDIYLGIDCEDFILQVAKKRFPKNIFLKCDILKHPIPNADYLLCSGALNILTKKDFLKAIENCFIASNKAFVFNFLSEKSIHTLKSEEVFNYCKQLTNKVSISKKYLDNDITFFLEK